jgi:peptidylprolyl isomerase
MAQAKNGDTVKVHYTGKVEDGTIFDTSTDRDPLQFTIGEGRIIPGFERAVIGMNPGESITIRISANEAYGPHRKEMVAEVRRDQFPGNVQPEVGQQFEIHQADGHSILVKVTDITESNVILDANHPLAGKDLIFDIQCLEVV